MSLALVVNNPSNYLIIAAEGRIMKGNEVVSNNHRKLTSLTDNVSLFSSGVQHCSEQLRTEVERRVNKDSTVEEIAKIIEYEAKKIHKQFTEEYPTYLMQSPNATSMSTIIGFFDMEKNESGYVKFCKSNDFKPEFITDSSMETSGLSQAKAQEYFLRIFSPDIAIDCVVDTFQYVGSIDCTVGGNLIIHVISSGGTNIYEGDIL